MTIAAMRGDFASASRGCPFETSPDCPSSEVSKVAGSPNSGGKLRFSNSGTKPALNRLTLSVPAYCPRAKGRGGARNRADRPSHALTKAQIANLKAAERHSAAIGLPFTRMLTIHWKAAGIACEGIAKATGAFIDRMTKWLSRRGHATAWVWVHENAGGKGWHCHLLIHIPASVVRQLPAAQKRWLRQITGRAYIAGVIHSAPIGGRLGLEKSNPELHFSNGKAALGYVCKGAPQQVLDSLQIERTHAPQGLILGRRCSTSQNIGKSARSKWVGVDERLRPSSRTPGGNASYIAKSVFHPRARGKF